MGAPEVVLAGVYLTWLALTCIAQMSVSARRRLRRLDVLHLLPSWHLFAPRPLRRDYSVRRSFVLTGGTISPWQELPPAPRRQPWSAIWHPESRRQKIIIDAARNLLVSHA